MPTRIIRDGILTSERVNALSPLAELFYRRLMSVADDHGRYSGNLTLIRSSCYPLKVDSVKEDSIKKHLAECVDAGLIVPYTIDGKPYILMVDFGQRINGKSKFPQPPAVSPGESRGIPGNIRLDVVEGGDVVGVDICTSEDVLVADGDQQNQQDRKRAEPAPVQKIVDLYHELLPALSRVDKLTSARRASCQQRWRDDLPTLEAWRNYFQDVAKSPFLLGRGPPRSNGKPWRADFEWLCKEGNFAKVLEGKYHA